MSFYHNCPGRFREKLQIMMPKIVLGAMLQKGPLMLAVQLLYLCPVS